MLLDLPLLCSMGLSSLLFLTDSHLGSDLLSFVRVSDVGMLLAVGPHHTLIVLIGSRFEGLICRKLSLVKHCHLHLLFLVRIFSFGTFILMMKSRYLLFWLLWPFSMNYPTALVSTLYSLVRPIILVLWLHRIGWVNKGIQLVRPIQILAVSVRNTLNVIVSGWMVHELQVILKLCWIELRFYL